MVIIIVKQNGLQKEILFIMPSHSWNFNYIRKAGYEIKEPYIGNKLLYRIFREVWFRWNLPGKSIWYNKKANVGSDTIAVMDSLIIPDYIKWLHDHNPDSRVILCYENKVQNSINPLELQDKWCEKLSTDIDDCTHYGLRYMPGGGYFKFLTVVKKKPKYDVFYIGRDKGRANKLFTLQDTFQSYGLSTYFHITATRRFQKYNKPYYKPLIPYEQVLDLIGESRSILHLSEGGQNGITIRIIESLIHQVKLITNDHKLREYDFYDKDNIFILGKDEIDGLPAFLDKPYKPLNSNIIESYYFDNYWNTILAEEG